MRLEREPSGMRRAWTLWPAGTAQSMKAADGVALRVSWRKLAKASSSAGLSLPLWIRSASRVLSRSIWSSLRESLSPMECEIWPIISLVVRNSARRVP